MSALVHLDEHVAALDGFELVGQIARQAVANIPEIEVVRRAHKDRWIFLRRVFGAIDVSCHTLAVAHWHHKLALDDCDRLQFFLD